MTEQILAAAGESGFRTMRLDTSKAQISAIVLYERAGFQRIPAYSELPSDLADWLRFFELHLQYCRTGQPDSRPAALLARRMAQSCC